MHTARQREIGDPEMKILLAMGLFGILLGCATPQAVGEKDLGLERLFTPIHIRDAKKICPVLNNGHGPYMWCAISKGEREIWFWFVPKEQVDTNDLEVAFITVGMAVDPDSQIVAWPRALLGTSLNQAYKKTYREFLKE
jgi:hypothetical protein